MNENITEKVEEEAAESAVEEINAEPATETEGEIAAAQTAAKPKSKMFIVYICALIVFMAVAATALVCFGLYANNLVHGENGADTINYVVECNEFDL